ncbi:hypothetical protein D8682_04865 [Buttiauxella sp. 3AFRM03]|nr:hypothetical protein D8682_04865 [Buttiauxella sp. 3AFRM03]
MIWIMCQGFDGVWVLNDARNGEVDDVPVMWHRWGKKWRKKKHTFYFAYIKVCFLVFYNSAVFGR